MRATRSQQLAGVWHFELPRFDDERGFFVENLRASWLTECGIDAQLVQSNVSFSKAGVLRGLHLQTQQPQGKLISVLRGRIFDVAVDLRPHSTTFGCWQSFELSADRPSQLWLPAGMAHGFYALEDALCLYQCSDYYHPGSEVCLHWQDPSLAIDWPSQTPVVSAKDQQGISLAAFCQRR